MIDLLSLLVAVGYPGLFLIIFAESGLFLGWFLPGDSLLFTAGILASLGYLKIIPVILLSFSGAVLGDSFGYYFGKRVGHRIFTSDNSIIFDKKHIQRAEVFYEAHGPKTIIIARFIPVIRTFVPILAGVGHMRYPVFLAYNLIGGFMWGVGIPVLGYYLGNTIPGIDRYLLPIILLIIIVSALPTAIQLLRQPEQRHRVGSIFHKIYDKIFPPVRE